MVDRPVTIEQQGNTEATESDIFVIVGEPRGSESVVRLHKFSRSTNIKQTHPDKITNPAVELEFRSGFVTGLLDS